MTRKIPYWVSGIFITGLLAGFALAHLAGVSLLGHAGAADAQEKDLAKPGAGAEPTLASLQAQIEALKGQTPVQSSAMASVAYHYGNLWFAAREKNWPLAEFYCEETEEHIEWAIKLEPIHETSQGEIDLKGIWDGVRDALFEPLEKIVKAKDSKGFPKAYKAMMEGCYSCHKSVEMPFLRPRVPARREGEIINFDPDAKWPR